MYRAIQHRNIAHQAELRTERPFLPSHDFREMRPLRTAGRSMSICIPINESSKSRAAPQCRQSPATVAVSLENYESPRPYANNASAAATNAPRSPSAADNRKIKTEMCKNMLTQGYCCWGSQCLFAHSEEERMSFTSVEEMAEHGVVSKGDVETYMRRVCGFWVSSGSCPYHTRCKSLHDPRLITTTVTPSWLEHYTKYNKKDPTLILDRLHHCRMNAVSQVNPLVEGWVWSECRPSLLGTSGSSPESDRDEEIWKDTYQLVTNQNVPIFSHQELSATNAKENVMSYSNVVNRNITSKVSELQRLCIVAAMRQPSKLPCHVGSESASLDFTYEPTHCLNGQPCMILQFRFYRLLDYKQKINVSSIEQVVEEISMQEYQRLASNLTVRAYEVVMDSKGKRSANLSIFFDVDITPCSNNKAKRVSKKGEDHWQLEDTTLFCMPKNDAFTSNLPSIKPYMMMQPVDDAKEGHALIDALLEHRIGTLLRVQGCRFGKLNTESLDVREGELKSKLILMTNHLKRDFWPVTSNMDHIKKTTEERNQTEYYPSHVEGSESAQHLWDSFVSNLSEDSAEPSSNRLAVFKSITAKRDCKRNLPRLKPTQHDLQPNASPFSEATWKELLEGQTGAWAAAKYSTSVVQGG